MVLDNMNDIMDSMFNKNSGELLLALSKLDKELSITVMGTSMEPVLKDGDVIKVKPCNNYEIGDIIVFLYKNNALLVHRLIKKRNKILLCKGDNSFRLEEVEEEYVLGKVISINSNHIYTIPNELIELSYLVNREFRKNRYEIDKTKNSPVYISFRNKLCSYIQEKQKSDLK